MDTVIDGFMNPLKDSFRTDYARDHGLVKTEPVDEGSSVSAGVLTPQQKNGSGIHAVGDGDAGGGMGYRKMFELMNPYKRPTREEIEVEKRKQRRNRTFAAISDAISALSNIYHTSRYSPNLWDPNKSMSRKSRERWEKIKAEKEREGRLWLEGYMRADAMDKEAARDSRNWKYRLERDKKADEMQKAAEERSRELDLPKKDKAEAEARYWQRKADEQDTLAEWADRQQEADYDKKMRTGKGGSGGHGRATSVWSAVDNKGVVHDFQAVDRANAHSYAGARGWKIVGEVKFEDHVEKTDLKTNSKSMESSKWTETDTPPKPKSAKSQVTI